ncbi:MAG TPA: 4-hydroxy-tetrahydrodipicolinate reductase [Thermoanaerobacterales bacterium]|nr:4-hydroxy-tetrahydrodipicolinate reductase [Thermoanaerobacterales bacterium]
MTNIVISGFKGRMGQSIFKMAQKFDDIKVVGAVEREDHPEIGSEVYKGLTLQDDVAPLLNENTVLIEFSNPAATVKHVEEAMKAKAKVIIGTTGLTSEQEDSIKKASEVIPILESHNYGLGMNTFWEILRNATKALGNDYEVEIVEYHGGDKPDVPSGTGLIIGNIIAEAKGVKFEDVVRYGRDITKTNVRKENEICYHSVRGGSYRADYTIVFLGDGERLEFTLREESVDIIARGAVLSAKFMETCKPGYYEMSDVLEFLRQAR